MLSDKLYVCVYEYRHWCGRVPNQISVRVLHNHPEDPRYRSAPVRGSSSELIEYAEVNVSDLKWVPAKPIVGEDNHELGEKIGTNILTKGK